MNVHDSRASAVHFNLSRAAWVIAVWAAAILMAIGVTVFGSAAAGPEQTLCPSPEPTGKLQGITPNSPDEPSASDLLPPVAY